MNKSISSRAPSTEQKLGLLRTLLISLASWLVTFYFCGKAIYTVLTSKSPRTKVDRVIRQWSAKLVEIVNLNIEIKGHFEPIEGRRYIIMCNHSSIYDIPVSFLAIPGTLRMLAKKELFRIPLFGRAMKMSEFVFINRSNKDEAKRDLALARERMQDGIMIWIAPEGTRSVDGELLPFKKGGMHLAIETQAMIVPVVIKDIHRVLPKNRFRMNCNQTVEFRIGQPIDASEFTLDKRSQLSQKVREKMLDLLKPEMGQF
ncbi:lysophospholipid acyltransferase family protein [Pleionea sediminis]|uniref:lysophospholipid acyltransferase family protein n=1 Tax=Pleionea sediminis TaxID=2569479 RepID=UPI0011864312|nr:lysophospholipid acyltransferase family protein [Pleionea sediminis]